MTTKTVTISMEALDIDNARAAAQAAGMTFSAFMAKAARELRLHDAGVRYLEYNRRPEVIAEMAEWDAMMAANDLATLHGETWAR
jgi:hypothetical protein